MSKRQHRILIVDDNDYTLRLVEIVMRDAGLRVTTAVSGEEAIAEIERSGLPDLAIVDLHMPGISGFEFARRVHQYSDLPVIMLTAVNQEEIIIEGLEDHAEDYVVKPFSPGELVARARRVLHRMGEFDFDLEPLVRIDDRLTIDFPNRVAIVAGKNETLTPTETKLLYILMRKAGSTVPTDYILRRLWPNEPVFEDRLHVHLHRLRYKIEDRHDKTRPRYITSERGAGYRFRALNDRHDSN
ncbi:MAG: response regulator transcription factor [Anaerolineae bacterium]|nr:response regulator transcription factor [Anaerolineae bacterium]